MEPALKKCYSEKQISIEISLTACTITCRKAPYPIRSITDGNYRYIRNLLPDNLYIEKHMMGLGKWNDPYWHTWVAESWRQPRIYELVQRFQNRPAEQLYHSREDPYEMENLAGSKKHSALQEQLSQALDQWLAQQKDPGAPLDSQETHQASKQGRHPY